MSASVVDRQPVLRVENLVKRYGGVVAVDHVSLEVYPGEIVGLIGANGSGKTTTFGTVAGVLRPDSGSIDFDGRAIANKPMHVVARRGLVHTFQLARPFPEMTVYENLKASVRGGRVEHDDLVCSSLELVHLDAKLSEFAGSLSYGQQKLLDIVRAVGVGAKIFLLDEPFAGVNPVMEQELIRLIKHIRENSDSSFLIIDHEMTIVMDLCDRIYVLGNGELICHGTPDEVRQDERTRQSYFGRRAGGLDS